MNLKLREIFSGVELSPEIANLEYPAHTATDSRNVRPGGAFVALEGEKTDGHKFIAQAIENGAKLLIVRKSNPNKNFANPANIPVIELDDPEHDLEKFASERLRKFPVKDIIAITGSVGKTTTRTALEQILKSRFKIHAPEKSFNTMISCAATILSMPLETEILLLEFGANKPGEIRELTEFFSPTIAILTAIAPVHLEGFKTLDGVLREKLEITRSRNIRKIVFNSDIDSLRFLEHVSVGTLGSREDLDFRIVFDESKFALPSLAFELQSSGEAAKFRADVWGKHVAMPLSLAAAAGKILGINLTEAAEILRNYQAMDGRGRIVFLSRERFLIDDAYNANPMSMRASLETFAEIDAPAKLAILGEMREMGEEAAKYHAELGNLIREIDNVILVGKIWREAFGGKFQNVEFVEDWQQALEITREKLDSGNVSGILVKGSNSLKLSEIVKYIEGNYKS